MKDAAHINRDKLSETFIRWLQCDSFVTLLKKTINIIWKKPIKICLENLFRKVHFLVYLLC